MNIYIYNLKRGDDIKILAHDEYEALFIFTNLGYSFKEHKKQGNCYNLK